MPINICIVTSTRADYGILSKLIKKINSDSFFNLSVIVTGTHLSKLHGYTVKQIKKEGYKNLFKIPFYNYKDSDLDLAKNSGMLIEKYTRKLKIIKPDTIILLGDRFEIFISAFVATFLRIPICHIHGGELTEGAYDDSFRHSITKMSHLHFVTCAIYKKRIIQLGENPNRIFNVGSLGVENINKLKISNKSYLEKEIDFHFKAKNFLITYHPVTLEPGYTEKHITELLNALSHYKHIGLIFTMPNIDSENSKIYKKINEFVKKNNNAKLFSSLGFQRYVSCIYFCDIVIGNSSSGIIEAPSLKTFTLNIGNRQNGRVSAKSVINCEPQKKHIIKAIDSILLKKKDKGYSIFRNPYDNGSSSNKIISILKNKNFKKLIYKSFFDMKL